MTQDGKFCLFFCLLLFVTWICFEISLYQMNPDNKTVSGTEEPEESEEKNEFNGK